MLLADLAPAAGPTLAAFLGAYMGQRVNIRRAAAAGREAALVVLRELRCCRLADAERVPTPVPLIADHE